MKSIELKPNFFIVGTAKSGTTTLYHHLKDHKDFFFHPIIKEPHYFSTKYVKMPHTGPYDEIRDRKRQSMPTLHDYLNLFKDATNEKIIADASVDYLYYYRTADDIKNFNPDAKIFIILRNPIERAYSAYFHQKREGREMLSFEEALKQEEDRIQNNYDFIWRYRQMGLYYEQVKYYLDVFGSENVKIFLFDDFKSDINKVIFDTLKFLNVNTDFKIDPLRKYNVTGDVKNKHLHRLLKYENPFKRILRLFLPKKTRSEIRYKLDLKNLKKKPQMQADTKKYLSEYYKSDILMTQRLIDRNLEHWLN